MRLHDRVKDAARDAIDALFSDRSVGAEETLEDLRDIRAKIQELIECLEDDLK